MGKPLSKMRIVKHTERPSGDCMIDFCKGRQPKQILAFQGHGQYHMIAYEESPLRSDLIAIFKIKWKSNGQETHSVNS